MIYEKEISTIPLGVASWFCVSKDHVVKITKSQGHWYFLGLGLFEKLELALIWAYKGSGLNIAQMGLAPDRKSTRLNSSHITRSRMPSSA